MWLINARRFRQSDELALWLLWHVRAVQMVLFAPHLPWGSGAPPKEKQRGLYMRGWICTMMLCASAALAEPATMIERFDAGARRSGGAILATM